MIMEKRTKKKQIVGFAIASMIVMVACGKQPENQNSTVETNNETNIDNSIESDNNDVQAAVSENDTADVQAAVSENDTDDVQTVVSENDTDVVDTISYEDTIDKIGSYMGGYIVDNSEDHNYEVKVEEILDGSEGATHTCVYENQELIRCTCVGYEGNGQTEYNMYVVDDGVFYTELHHYYDSYYFENVDSVLYSQLKEYWICGDEVYLIDRIGEQMIPCEEIEFVEDILERVEWMSSAGS